MIGKNIYTVSRFHLLSKAKGVGRFCIDRFPRFLISISHAVKATSPQTSAFYHKLVLGNNSARGALRLECLPQETKKTAPI
jgi:hypothetical protein